MFLLQAILLSKLDYEEKKDVYKQLKKEADQVKKLEDLSRTGNKKQKKKNVMSLEQFNDMVSNNDEPNCKLILCYVCCCFFIILKTDCNLNKT